MYPLIASLFPSVSLVIGIMIGTQWTISELTEKALEQLIAGIFLAVISLILIPSLKLDSKSVNDKAVVIGGVIGMALAFSTACFKSHRIRNEGCKGLASRALHNFLDGIITGSSAQTFKGSHKYAVSAWLSIDNLIYGIQIANELKADKKQLALYGTLLPAVIMLGGFVGGFVSGKTTSAVQSGMMAFSIATLLWILTTELIPTEPLSSMIYPVMMYIGFMSIFLAYRLDWFK